MAEQTKELICDNQKDGKVYATETGVYVGMIIVDMPGSLGTMHCKVLPNPRVCLPAVAFKSFPAAENYIRAVEAETRFIDLHHDGRSPFAATETPSSNVEKVYYKNPHS